MLRLIFASGLLLFGAVQSLRGPFYALLLYLFIAYFRPETWIWTNELRVLPFSFMVGLYAVGSAVVSREPFRFTAGTWLIVVFCLHGLLSTLLSPYFAWCFFWWQGFARVAVIAILIIGLVNTRERLRLTLVVLAFALGFEGAKQGWVHLISAPDQQNMNSIEILGDNNGVATGMLMLAAVLLALVQTTEKKWLKWLFGFTLLGVVFRSLTSYSRGGFLAFGAMCAMYTARSRHRIRTALLMTGVLLLLTQLPDAYWNRMDTITTENEDDGSVQGRLYYWQVARQMGNQNPLLGVGTSGFQAAYNFYDETNGVYGRSKAVHSMWFGTLAEQGYVGLFMLCTILIMALRAAGRARKAARKAGDEQVFAFAGALQTALVTVCVGGSFLSYHYVEILWHFIGLSFAVERVALLERAPAVTKVPVVARPQPAYGAG
jgi:probable O-glycosylation ligase (exosortase A-associated)